tara:strand:+ start:41232 stop:41585 length:354 start_codon:yes stop_codon:yes gene_type:complete
MKDGQKLFVTANYGFDYNRGHLDHLVTFDILTQFFEHRNNLKGFVKDEDGDMHIAEGSEVSILIDALYRGFDEKNVPKVVETYLLKFEMYTTLSEYHAPLEGEAITYREELLSLIED